MYFPKENAMVAGGESTTNYAITTQSETGTSTEYYSQRKSMLFYKYSLETGEILWYNSEPIKNYLRSSRRNFSSNSFTLYQANENQLAINYYSSFIYEDKLAERSNFIARNYNTSSHTALLDINTGKFESVPMKKAETQTTALERVNISNRIYYDNKLYSFASTRLVKPWRYTWLPLLGITGIGTIPAYIIYKSSNKWRYDYKVGVLELED